MADYASHIAQHYSDVIQDNVKERAFSDIIELRNFNNFIKSYLIDTYINKIKDSNVSEHQIKVLDLCCGKGGDMNKWFYSHVSYVAFVDIAEISIEQCQERYKSKKALGKIFEAVFLTADCCQADLKSLYARNDIENIKFDIVSCQFALHYAFESLERLKQMIVNITSNLNKGGFFIGTMTDAYKLMKILHSLPDQCDENANTPYIYKNGICTIVYDHPSFSEWKNGQNKKDINPSPPPLFGANYHFTLDQRVDCPEFLAYFPLLVKLMKENGFQLVYKKNFHTIYQETKNNKDMIDLASRMKIYEIYRGSFRAPPDSFKSNVEHEYGELIKTLKTQNGSNTNNRQPCTNWGSIAQSEWDVIVVEEITGKSYLRRLQQDLALPLDSI